MSNLRPAFEILQKCIITTSSPLLDFYEKVISASEVDTFFIYNCLHEENVETLPAAHHYEIIIDFNNNDIYNIIVTIFNKLLKFNCDLYVKILEVPAVDRPDIESCINLLRKLEDKNLIKLKIANNKTQSYTRDLFESPLDNVTCFIGPGNTGKTSIMASVSELFSEKGQRVALLDLTKEHKLKEYLPYNTNISSISIGHNSKEQFFSDFQNIHADFPHLYTYDISTKYGLPEIAFLCKAIKDLSSSYDFVLINADKHAMKNSIDIFKLSTSIFIVHDCMLNKIHPTHEMLLRLQESGIITQKTVSIIYNKVLRKASDIGNIEEKLIFKKDRMGHLIPLIDIKCMTLEILHNKKIAMALNSKIITKENALNKASLNYIVNIERLYNFINNIKDCEYSDLQLSEFVRNHAYSIVHNFFSMKINYFFQSTIKLNDIYRVTKVGLEKWISAAKEMRSKYFKSKFQRVFK